MGRTEWGAEPRPEKGAGKGRNAAKLLCQQRSSNLPSGVVGGDFWVHRGGPTQTPELAELEKTS